jgi:hypothetical protein
MQQSSVLISCHDRFAYVEFAEADNVDAALALDNSLFKGRLIKVRDILDPTSDPTNISFCRLQRSGRTFQGLTAVEEGEVDTVEASEAGTGGITHTIAQGAGTSYINIFVLTY